MSTPTTLEGTIETTAEDIYLQLTEGVDSVIETGIDGWCELHGLERLDDPLSVVARQAAFNVLLKGTLYEHYHQRGVLPELESDYRDALASAQKTTSDPAFQEYILDDIVWQVEPGSLEDILAARHQLLSTEEPAEEIGRLFEVLTPQESRRKLGQFRTPIPIADLMADWIIRDGTETVLDPGMGACALSAAAYRKKQQKVDDPLLSDIYGVDLNELALVMGATTLTLMDHGEPHNLQIGDFLDFTLDHVDGKVDSVISNPPYSRHHELSEEYKSRVNSKAEAEVGRNVSALSPMYAYFYYHASQFLKPGGRMSFITPSEFLETSYGESTKQYLAEEFDVKALVLFDRDDDSVFSEAMTTSLVSFLEKPDGDEEDEFTRFIRVDEFPGEPELMEAITDGVEGETDWGFVNKVKQDELDAEDKWTEFFDPIGVDTSQLTSLSELATVNRGIATGANSFFCLSQSEVDDWGIEEDYLSPLVRNSRSVPAYDYRTDDWEQQRSDGDEVWLLYHLEDLDWDYESYEQKQETQDNARLNDYTSSEPDAVEEHHPNVVEYLKHGMTDDVGANGSYLARKRNPWFIVDRRDPAPILVTYMSRGGCRFIFNETKARTLNNLHSIYFDVDLNKDEQRALLAYLNSGFADEVIRRSGRTYSTGMDKIEPNEMESVPVLDPRSLDGETVSELAMLFDELREAARRESMDIEAVVTEIDQSLEKMFEAQ